MTREEIYRKNIELQSIAHDIIGACHIQNYDRVVRLFTRLTTGFMQVIESVFQDLEFFNQEDLVVNPEGVSASLQDILCAQENQDYVLLADLLELQLLPFLQSLQQQIRCYEPVGVENCVWENNMWVLKQGNETLYKELLQYHTRYEKEKADGIWEGCHHLEDTNSGAFTMAGVDESGAYYYHSNVEPYKEAEDFATYYESPGCKEYVLWGLGLGYHVLALWKRDTGVTLSVYESDLDVIYHCMMAVDMREFLSSPEVHFVYDPDFKKIIGALDRVTENVILHYPSLRHISDKNLRSQMEMFFIRDSGKRNMATLFVSNFRENKKHYAGGVDGLAPDFQGKKVVIVAAGPSLDKNVHLLKEHSKDIIVLATGTVFRKLLDLGISVDYVIVSDANERVYSQIAGLEQEQVPMLYLSTAYRGFSKNYQGRKYMICQRGYDEAEALAEEKGWSLHETGGSVSTTALDVCLNMDCESIAFIGLDLAYTDNLAHATGTSKREAAEASDMEKVPGIDGSMVPASKLFQMYNRWISNRVKQRDVTIPVYDATEGGALVDGLINVPLEKYLGQ